MRVCFVAHRTYSDTLGGADRSLLNLIDGSTALGWKPFVLLAKPGSFADALATRGVDFHISRHWNSMGAPLSIRRFWHAPHDIASRLRRGCRNTWATHNAARALRSFKPDIVYTNSTVTDFGLRMSRLLRVPHIWHVRELPDYTRGIHPAAGWHKFRSYFKESALCIAISHAVRTRTLEGISPDRVRVIYNGVFPKSRFQEMLHRRIGWRDRADVTPTFAIVGGISAAKGQHTAIEAISLLKQQGTTVRLKVVGDGNVTPLRKFAQQMGVSDQVIFTGYHHDPWAELSTIHATLMCSLDEPMGRVTAEAMAACIPVIGYKGGATPELIEDGRTGLLYQRGASELAQKMQWVLKNGSDADKIASNAWADATERFTQESYARNVVAAVENSVAAPHRLPRGRNMR